MTFALHLRICDVPEWPPDADACFDELEPEPEESDSPAEGEGDFWD